MDELNWRAASDPDATGLAVLFGEIARAAPVGLETSRDEVEARLSLPRLALGRDTLVGTDAAGRVLAYAEAADMGVGQGRFRVRLTSAVHPDLPGRHAQRMHDWLLTRASQLRRERHPDLPGVAGARCAATDRTRLAMLTDAGFKIAQWELDLMRKLEQPGPAAVVPDGIDITPYDADRDEAVRVAHNQAYAEHPNALLPDAESWPQHAVGLANFLPEVSLIATAGEQVAGFLFSLERRDPAGGREGVLHCLGTTAPWRRRGLASAMIGQALDRCRERGYGVARLQVSSTNTAATRLYDRLGFTDSGRGYAILHGPLS